MTTIAIPDECPVCHAWSPEFYDGFVGGDGCCWLECRCGSYSPLAEGWGEAYALWVKNPQFFPPREAQSSKPPL